MHIKLIVITYCISTDFGAALKATPANKGPNFQSDGTVAEDVGNATDTKDSRPLDSHEAMNNRESTPREKRSFEFLVGLINNNSKYEVLRSDPSSLSPDISKEDSIHSPTVLLLNLISKIVTYPDNWNKVHQLLRNIDEGLSNSQNILTKQNSIQHLKRKDGTGSGDEDGVLTKSGIGKNFIETWPRFEESSENSSSVDKDPVSNAEMKSSEKTYQKNFAYHKVKGNPTRLKKNTTAYIAVSAVSSRLLNSQSEEDFALETELQRLKPWRNKNDKEKISKHDVSIA
ncbi:uncharacterized protein LOC132707988 isoform X3 [Cylas formicarius]|uniref:uncharacterized protein LOC132707988 isoform X3 n=1 Tax=Cylas formicarius TaxID=197179 RepID=UPI002958B80F|nr:uncharacterized protein LOC132707988 isoform X3 [Cylas formicarius]